MSDITLIVDGKLIKDDGEIFSQLVTILREMQDGVAKVEFMANQSMTAISAEIAKIESTLMNVISMLASEVDKMIVAITDLLTQEVPDVKEALKIISNLADTMKSVTPL